VTVPRQLGALAVVASLVSWRDGSAAPPAAEPAAPTSPQGVPVTTSREVTPRDDDDGAVRLSLPTEEERAAWRRSGFRLALGVLYGDLRGAGAVPDLTLKGVVIRPGIRIDPQWSIYLPLQYAVTDHGGARFAAAVEPTWHVTPSFALGFGLGYAGLIGVSPYGDFDFDSGPERDTGMLGQSYTYPDAKVPVRSCDGVGVTALARAELGYVLGPRARTHLALEALGQRIGCEESAPGRDSFTGTEYKFRQWWGHSGVSLSWGIEWR
jgi:hypothetical protein